MRSHFAAAVLLIISPFAAAHPASLICNDPRLVDGGNLMHSYLTINNHQSDLTLTANATQYKYGETIRLDITANGSRYVTTDAPLGVFVALQVVFTGPNGEAMGQFHDASPDLDYTPGCSSSVFSKTANKFTGKSYVHWTPHNDGRLRTRGNATFQLVFSNGPGGGDATAASYGIKIPNPYMYMVTLDLWDPERWNPTTPSPSPPSNPGADAKCEVGRPPEQQQDGIVHSYKGSPVFVQHLSKESQTFGTGRCLPCRADQRDKCLSALVVCPSQIGQPVVQSLWKYSRRCVGSADHVHAVPHEAGISDTDYIVCPEPEHFSTKPEYLDLDRFVPKLQRDFPLDFPDNTTAENAIAEYRKMLTLVQKYPHDPIVPSPLVDHVWHTHILDTERYHRDSLRLFGFYLHHAPSFGGNEEKEILRDQQRRMLQNYEKTFGVSPSPLWQSGNKEKSPDCCSALCVKPNCNSCVGCNAVHCGYMESNGRVNNDSSKILDGEHETRNILSPNQFSGYVPLAPSKNVKQLTKAEVLAGKSLAKPIYACSIQPMKDMSFSWSISGNFIYMQQTVAGESWYGIGLNNVSGMGFADYMVTMYTKNYSGIKDMYVYNEQAGYPCWDVLDECSAGNKTKGTKDVEEEQLVRQQGVTTSSWNRKLVTGDYKDYPIVKGINATVLFARGTEDYFTYHGENIQECIVDFFTGAYDC